tara:strand:- start:176 stop:2449 length:2274 start_codon:yes stop_codon:yes gene_type:complete
MSDLEETTTGNDMSILSIDRLEKRRAYLAEFMDAIQHYENSLNAYDTSEERVEVLTESREIYNEQIRSLENKNEILLEFIAKEPEKLQRLNEYTQNINDMVNANPHKVPNLKITKISGWVSNTTVIGIKLELSDSGKSEYGLNPDDGWSGGTKVGPFILDANEFLVKIDKIGSTTGGQLGNGVVFYTSFGRKHIIKGTNTDIDPSKFSEEKTFIVNTTEARWEWHEKEAKRRGYTLATIADWGENNKVASMIRAQGLGSAWAGGIRTRRGRSRGSDNWKWSDGTPWNFLSAWNGGEPNDCCGGENYLQVRPNGRWNDLFPANLPAVYSKKAQNYSTDTVTSGGSGMAITSVINFADLSVETNSQYSEDKSATATLQALKNDVYELQTSLGQDTDDYSIEYQENLDLITHLGWLISDIDIQIDGITRLNASVQEGFGNINELGNKLKTWMDNIFGNSNKPMREGNTGMGDQSELTTPWYNGVSQVISETKQSLNAEMAITDRVEYEEERNYMLELISQKDNVLSDVLMDYMVNDTEGSNAEKIYEELNQENHDKLRKIKMNEYNTKTYVEYSSILKFIVFLIVIMIPFLLLAKYEIINPKISLTVVVMISFIGFLNVVYRMFVLSRKDNKDFDKDTIPHDRRGIELSNQGKNIKKTNLMGGLGITCIGEQCCTDGMSYDATKNRCFTTSENFGNFFEKTNKASNQIESVIEDNDLHEVSKEFSYIKEPFLSSSADLASFKTKALLESLNNSSADKMFK